MKKWYPGHKLSCLGPDHGSYGAHCRFASHHRETSCNVGRQKKFECTCRTNVERGSYGMVAKKRAHERQPYRTKSVLKVVFLLFMLISVGSVQLWDMYNEANSTRCYHILLLSTAYKL